MKRQHLLILSIGFSLSAMDEGHQMTTWNAGDSNVLNSGYGYGGSGYGYGGMANDPSALESGMAARPGGGMLTPIIEATEGMQSAASSLRAAPSIYGGNIPEDESHLIPVDIEANAGLTEIVAPPAAHDELVRQGLCYIGTDGKLYPNMTRFDFAQFTKIIQSVANILGEITTIKDALTGSETALETERTARASDQASNNKKFKIAVLAGVGTFVTTITPSIIALVEALRK